MNKELLLDLPYESLSHNAKRLELAIEELHFLLDDMLQEKHELVTENRQLLDKVFSLTPDESGLWDRMLRFAKNKWESVFPVKQFSDVISEDREEWTKIIRHMTQETATHFERFEVEYVDMENNSILSYLSSSGTLIRYQNSVFILTVVNKLVVNHAQTHQFYLQDGRNRFIFAYKDSFIHLKLQKIINLNDHFKHLQTHITQDKHLLILSPDSSLPFLNLSELTTLNPDIDSLLTLISSPFGILSRMHYENSQELCRCLVSLSPSVFLISGRNIPGTDGGTVYNSSSQVCGIVIETNIQSILCVIHIVISTQNEVVNIIDYYIYKPRSPNL